MVWLTQVRAEARRGIAAPTDLRDVHALIDEMRLYKDESELALMRRSATIAAAAHRRAMRAARPGRGEFEIEAELLHEFRRHGAQGPSYTPIVAAGEHACVLHYVTNDGMLDDGALLLIDAGCELDGYASDVTRTFPVNGRYSAPHGRSTSWCWRPRPRHWPRSVRATRGRPAYGRRPDALRRG